MGSGDLDPNIRQFYQERYREDGRLTRSAHGQLEFLRVQELVRRFLPKPPARVLDVGGATGIHAKWLADDGYVIHMIDPVPNHVNAAAQHGGYSVALGDARALDEPDDSADAVLLFGPLYHLVDHADRLLALRESVRVVRPGGQVMAAAISRHAPVIEFGATAGIASKDLETWRQILATGHHDNEPDGFTAAHFHTAEELTDELRDAGLSDVTVLGIEGPTTPALDAAPLEQLSQLLPSAVLCARLLESEPQVIGASPHLLALGNV